MQARLSLTLHRYALSPAQHAMQGPRMLLFPHLSPNTIGWVHRMFARSQMPGVTLW